MLTLLALLLTSANAQDPVVPDINSQLYRPVMDSRHTLWTNDSGGIRDDGLFLARGVLHYVNRPLVFVPDQGDNLVLVSDALQLDALAMYQVNRFRFGIDVPIYLFSAGQLSQNGAGLGDIALDGRATILDRTKTPVGIAINGRITLPTTTVDAALGARGLGGEIEAVVDRQFTDELLIAVNLGTRFLPSRESLNINQNDQFYFRLGGGYALTDSAGISLDFVGTANYSQPLSERANLPLEVLAGGWGRLTDSLVFRGGIGTGITPGVGSPPLRLVTMLSFEPQENKDFDGDGILDKFDACPDKPEDFDGFEDEDGCPDPDNDGDGILDVDDKCPNDAEDFDGYQDDDGCPDPSMQFRITVKDDKGNILTGATAFVQDANRIRTEAGGDALIDIHEGTYTLFAEMPGYIQGKKEFQAPGPGDKNEAVIIVYPDVPQGTLKLTVVDASKQPIADASWTLDNNPGNAFASGLTEMTVPAGKHAIDVRAPGYVSSRVQVNLPRDQVTEMIIELKPSQVKVTRERIDVKGTIYFQTGSAKIKPESFPLLDDVASTLLDNPDITKVSIEGHTDSRGSDSLNLRLSKDRAKSVLEYMKKAGVAAERLVSEGFGESCPVDPRENEEAWEKNRRVDFFIVGRDGKVLEAASPCKP